MRNICRKADEVIIWIDHSPNYRGCEVWHTCLPELPSLSLEEEVKRAWDMVRDHFGDEPNAGVKPVASPVGTVLGDLLVGYSRERWRAICSDDIEANIATVFGKAIGYGLLPASLQDFLPEWLSPATRKSLARQVQAYYFRY